MFCIQFSGLTRNNSSACQLNYKFRLPYALPPQTLCHATKFIVRSNFSALCIDRKFVVKVLLYCWIFCYAFHEDAANKKAYFITPCPPLNNRLVLHESSWETIVINSFSKRSLSFRFYSANCSFRGLKEVSF